MKIHERVVEAIGQKRGAIAAAARATKIDPSQLSKMLRGDLNFTIENLLLLEKYTGVNFFSEYSDEDQGYIDKCLKYKSDPDFNNIILAYQIFKDLTCGKRNDIEAIVKGLTAALVREVTVWGLANGISLESEGGNIPDNKHHKVNLRKASPEKKTQKKKSSK